ncbi:MAG: DUF459 domain-containing protein [Pseudolabrys sp.]
MPATSFAGPVTIAVIGDSIATELGHGMQALFRHNRHVRVIKRTKYSTGLVRTDYFNWDRALQYFLRHHRADKIAVVIGGNDRQSVNVGHRRLQRFSRAWRHNYQRRVVRFMRILKRAHAYRREAKRHGFTYVSIWKTFSNSNGAYTSFGRVGGRRRRLRQYDGMHFTAAGSRVLAKHVARAMHLR